MHFIDLFICVGLFSPCFCENCFYSQQLRCKQFLISLSMKIALFQQPIMPLVSNLPCFFEVLCEISDLCYYSFQCLTCLYMSSFLSCGSLISGRFTT